METLPGPTGLSAPGSGEALCLAVRRRELEAPPCDPGRLHLSFEPGSA